MKKKRILHFRNVIVQKMAEIEQVESKDPAKARRMSTGSADPMDDVPLELDLHMELSIRERRGRTLRELQQALERIDRGLFGICQSCGDDIPDRRLVLRPAGRLCKVCQQREEESDRAVHHRSVFEDWPAEGCYE
ncbi:MAG TPA: TraR/DksA family transcriptional regulator [Syntrophales bacterium]|nr:TraR/DksA family transcriptional regulator [Syntrophales bacterium]